MHDIKATRARGADGLPIADPTGLLQWLAKDRAMAVFQDTPDFDRTTKALVDLVSRWLVRA